MNQLCRTVVLVLSALAALLTAAPAHAKPPEPVVQTGDVQVMTGDYDILEDVMEHITMKRGNGATLHQLYDHSNGTALPE